MPWTNRSLFGVLGAFLCAMSVSTPLSTPPRTIRAAGAPLEAQSHRVTVIKNVSEETSSSILLFAKRILSEKGI